MTGLREVEIQAFVLFRTTHLPAEPLTVPWACAIAHLLPHHLEVPKPLPLPIIRAKGPARGLLHPLELFTKRYARIAGTETIVPTLKMFPLSLADCKPVAPHVHGGATGWSWQQLLPFHRRGFSGCRVSHWPATSKALQTFAFVTPALTLVTVFCVLIMCQRGHGTDPLYILSRLPFMTMRKLDIIIPFDIKASEDQKT